MKKLYALLFLSIALCACGSKERHTEIETARRMGHNQAMELATGAIPLDTIDIEIMLIDVRARENALRKRGHDKIADAYISSFLATLDSVNTPLSAQLKN